MSKIIISGNKKYTSRMYKHLRKEHPSTRQRMILKDRNSTTTEDDDYRCEICNKKLKNLNFSTTRCINHMGLPNNKKE